MAPPLASLLLLPLLLHSASAQQASAAAAPTRPQQAEDFSQESAADKAARMQWFADAKFGLFIHWGLYSEAGGRFPGHDEMGGGGREWIQDNLRIPAAAYAAELLPRFNPTGYDPEAWATLAEEAGVKYIVITSQHHDGFSLWDRSDSDFDITATPHGEDLLGPLAAASRAHGLRFCTYHTIMDWHDPDYGTVRDWRGNNPEASGHQPDMEAFFQRKKAQVAEIIETLQPDILWFDGEWEEAWNHEYGRELYNWCRTLDPEIIVNNRVDKGREGMAGMSKGEHFAGDYGTPEQEIPATGFGPGVYWESCMTMNTTWGFAFNDENWKSTEQLVKNLVDIVSKGGNYLLNVGPDGQGRIPEASVTRLREIGAWMKVNGEAIYGTQANPFAELPFDGRITVKQHEDGHSTIYCHLFAWPERGELPLPALPAGTVMASWRLLGSEREIRPSTAADTLELGEAEDALGPVAVVAIELEGALTLPAPATAANGNEVSGSL